jgi:hypothetical protein
MGRTFQEMIEDSLDMTEKEIKTSSLGKRAQYIGEQMMNATKREGKDRE